MIGRGSTSLSPGGLMASSDSRRAFRLYITSVSSGSCISRPTALPMARISSLVKSALVASPFQIRWAHIAAKRPRRQDACRLHLAHLEAPYRVGYTGQNLVEDEIKLWLRMRPSLSTWAWSPTISNFLRRGPYAIGHTSWYEAGRGSTNSFQMSARTKRRKWWTGPGYSCVRHTVGASSTPKGFASMDPTPNWSDFQSASKMAT